MPSSAGEKVLLLSTQGHSEWLFFIRQREEGRRKFVTVPTFLHCGKTPSCSAAVGFDGEKMELLSVYLYLSLHFKEFWNFVSTASVLKAFFLYLAGAEFLPCVSVLHY